MPMLPLSRRTLVLGLPLGLTACGPAVIASGTNLTSTPWPENQRFWGQAPSRSANLATLPADLQLTPPPSTAPLALRQAVGKWEGWMGANASLSAALAIQEVTEEGGTATYAFANNTQPSRHWTWRFRRHDGNELRGTIGNGPATLTTRLRRDGAMDVLWQNGDAWASGVLTRMTPIFA